MANRFQKMVYYLSAGAPFLLILATVELFKKSKWTEPRDINWEIPAIIYSVAILLILEFFFFFSRVKTTLSIERVTGSEFKCIDNWIVGYLITYLSPFLSAVIDEINLIAQLIVFALLIIVLTVSDYVTPHPLLFFRGYHFYELKVEGHASDYKVISKKQIRNVRDISIISRVFEFLLLRVEK